MVGLSSYGKEIAGLIFLENAMESTVMKNCVTHNHVQLGNNGDLMVHVQNLVMAELSSGKDIAHLGIQEIVQGIVNYLWSVTHNPVQHGIGGVHMVHVQSLVMVELS